MASVTYAWDEQSTYIKNPPYFENFDLQAAGTTDVEGARVLAVVGDTVTTDHISPAGAIPKEYPAGKYLYPRGSNPYSSTLTDRGAATTK